MKFRVISLLLALVLVALLIPAPASAAGVEAADIMLQIRNTYLTALRRSGRYSFNGFCGSMVNWQTHLLGIDEHVIGCDGKDEYDKYTAMGTTTGGYKVKSYPAGQYTLKSALNAITADGTQDAYNILVGFQRTNTREGSIYGHALLIHAIIDGTVYFAECFNVSLNGRFWGEGEAIYCSIDDFCDYYNRWTVFDGVAYFGVKTYADVCTAYEAGMYAMAVQELTVYEEPFDADVYVAEATGDTVMKGEKVAVESLLETPGGSWWYKLQSGGYVEAKQLVRVADNYEDMTVTDLKVPGALRRGVGFVLRGGVAARSSRIRSVEVIVYDPEEGIENPAFSGMLEVDGSSASLSDYKMERAMTFRLLDTGTYCITIRAEVSSYALEDGRPVLHSAAVTLWNSQFSIITGWDRYANISFDGNGGTAALDRKTVKLGDGAGQLPGASRAGYVFAGWALDAAGKQMVTENTVIEGDAVLFAQWSKGQTKLSGWQKNKSSWSYYQNGSLAEGWFQSAGVKFYQRSGKLFTGWHIVDGVERYFNRAGALLSGWQTIGGDQYYLREDGSKTTGWYHEDGGSFYFDEEGVQQTEWVFLDGDWYYLYRQGSMAVGECTIEGAVCRFEDNGILELAQKVTAGGIYYVVYDRAAASSNMEVGESLLLG